MVLRNTTKGHLILTTTATIAVVINGTFSMFKGDTEELLAASEKLRKFTALKGCTIGEVASALLRDQFQRHGDDLNTNGLLYLFAWALYQHNSQRVREHCLAGLPISIVVFHLGKHIWTAGALHHTPLDHTRDEVVQLAQLAASPGATLMRQISVEQPEVFAKLISKMGKNIARLAKDQPHPVSADCVLVMG